MGLVENGRHLVREAVVSYLARESGQTAFVVGDAPVSLPLDLTVSDGAQAFGQTAVSDPLVITLGVNDQFVFTPIATGIPETFTMAPGTFTGAGEIDEEIENAIGSAHGEIFNTVCQLNDIAPNLLLLSYYPGSIHNGDTFSEGNGGALALGVTATLTFSGGTSGINTFYFTGQGGAGTPELFTIAPATYTDLVSLQLAVEAATGTNIVGGFPDTFGDYCYVTNNQQQDNPEGELIFTMADSGGVLNVGNTITEGDGGAAALGFTGNPDTFDVQSVNIPHLSLVYGFPAKFTPEGDLYPQDDPGVQSGAILYVYMGRSSDNRVAFGGRHGGRKWVPYEITLRCLFFSQKALSQDAGYDNEAFLDGLVATIRADRNAGEPSVVFELGEGGVNGGPDIEVTSYYPQDVKGALSTTLTVSEVKIQTVQVLAT